jgi:hypothetical protein
MDGPRKFSHDVFLSYAHIDNDPDPFGTCWVSQFETDLKNALNKLGHFDDLRIFRDAKELHGGPLEELRKKVQGSAIFVAVLSPNYVRRPWTLEELRTFRVTPGAAERLAVVELLPLPPGVAYPEGTEGLVRRHFHRRDPVTGLPISISVKREPADYDREINIIANHLVDLHRRIAARPAEPPPPPPAPATEAVVLLGRVTDDLQGVREQVRSHLEQFGITVIPRDDYPDGGTQFRERFDHDVVHLTKAKRGLFVQLIGPHPSRRPAEIPQGYERYQIDAAGKAGVPVLHWRSDSFDPSTITDAQHGEVLAGALAMSLQKLKQHIQEHCQPPRDERFEEKLRQKNTGGSQLVFVNSDQADVTLAGEIERALKENNFSVVLADSDDYDDLDLNIQICEALVVVFGAASPKWVKRQLQYYLKEKQKRGSDPLVSVYEGPPEPKGPIGIHLAEVRHVNDIGKLIAQLRGERPLN